MLKTIHGRITPATTGQRDPYVHSRDQRLRLGLLVVAAVLLASDLAVGQDTLNSPAVCVAPGQTRLIEWDVLPNGTLDAVPGDLVVEDRSSSRHSKVWFATKVGGEVRAYRLTPGRNLKKDKAEAKSWPLGALTSGGIRLRPSGDGKFVFVNAEPQLVDPASGVLVAIDTEANTRTTWADRPFRGSFHTSDVAVDSRDRRHSVFTAAPEYTGAVEEFEPGFVQRLTPGDPKYENGKLVVPAEATRWNVGGNAGECTDTLQLAPCMPGVAVDHRHGHPVYFSAPDFAFTKSPNTGRVGAIGELDPRLVKCSVYDLYPSCSKVRYWPLQTSPAEPLPDPRQVNVDEHGRVWTVGGNGKVYSLGSERSSDRGILTRHNPIGPAEPESLYSVAPDGGTVGFTDANNNEVSVLFPDPTPQKVVPEIRLVKAQTITLLGIRENVDAVMHLVDPRQATPLIVEKYTIPGDGTYIESDISSAVADDPSSIDASSRQPTGIYQDAARKTGSFFYGVTLRGLLLSTRVGHLEVRVDPDKELDHRKDDDDYDDDGEDDAYDGDDDNDGVGDALDTDDDNDCIPDFMDKDKDNDGVEDEYDSQSHRENKRTDRGQIGPGQAVSYEMVSDPRTGLLIAVVEAASLTTPLSMQIVDPNGAVVLSTPPALGKAIATATPALAGVYTVRVTNAGTTSATYKARLLTRQAWF